MPIEIIEDESEIEARKAAQVRAEQREIDDLAALQDMNEATQRMAYLSPYQFALVFVGTIALIFTLYFTRKANRAAFAAIDVTREMGQRELRAYVSFPHIETFTGTDHSRANQPRRVHGYELRITVENAGATPAVDCFISCDHSLVDTKNFQSPAFEKAADDGGRTAIGPHSRVQAPYRYINRDDAQKVLEKKARLILWCRIDYRDVFDRSPDRLVEQTWEVLIPANPKVLAPGDSSPVFTFKTLGQILS